MQKILNKQQIQVIMLLNAVLAVLFFGILLSYGDGTRSVSGTAKPAHRLIRTARVSASPYLQWEINVGGTADESIKNMYSVPGGIYLFGSTFSRDLDFASAAEGNHAFAARLASDGTTQSFVVYGGEPVKALPFQNGFILACNTTDGSRVLVLDDDCVLVKTIESDKTFSRRIVDLQLHGNAFYVISEVKNPAVPLTRLSVTAYNENFDKVFDKLFSKPYDFTYIANLPHPDGFTLWASVRTETAHYAYAMRYTDVAESEIVYTPVSVGYAYATHSVMPGATGYALATTRDDRPEILLTDFSGKPKKTLHLGESAHTAFSLHAGNDKYFVHIASTDETDNEVTEYGFDFGSGNGISLNMRMQNVLDVAFNAQAHFLLGRTENALVLHALSKDGTKKQSSFATQNERDCLLLPVADGILCATTSPTSSEDVGDNFGGTDVWLAKLRY